MTERPAARYGPDEPRHPEAPETPEALETSGPPGLSSLDEEALRGLLHDRVDRLNLEPPPETLAHLRRAVPARRARRRATLVAAAALAVLGGLAVPLALTHDPAASGGDHRTPQAHDMPSSLESEGGAARGEKQGDSAAALPDGTAPGAEPTGEPDVPGSPGVSEDSAGPDPSDTLIATSPTCSSDQLSRGVPVYSEPDAQGRIYGSFRVTNVSRTSCAVGSEGIVRADPAGQVSAASVPVQKYEEGDPATGLSGEGETEELVLAPAQAYVMQFAWVPDEDPGAGSVCSASSPPPGGGDSSGGPGTGDDVVPQAAPLAVTPETAGTPGTAGTKAAQEPTPAEVPSDSVEPQETGDPGTGEEPQTGVVVTHTPDVGAPEATAVTLPEACGSGTVYHTGMLPAE